jgi:CubicO group peptidase (beta-lactamase class C family)
MPHAGLFDGDGKPKQPIIVTAMAPAGGLHSNAVDMISYLRYQLNPPNTVLGRAARITQETFYQDKDQGVGLGWEMQNGYIEKTADTWGNFCMLGFDPKTRAGVIVLSDHRDSQLVQDLVAAIFKQLK